MGKLKSALFNTTVSSTFVPYCRSSERKFQAPFAFIINLVYLSVLLLELLFEL